MKIFIRRLSYTNEDEKDRIRLHLNALGFYCLSDGCDLLVYAIDTQRYWFGIPVWWD